uniref:Uncharacterized protein n=1 Tax=Phytophthora fragariae TaxID=53985 RepID=A0A6A3EE84_9STRA|nr:hypothetical protein PF009_g18017 [Phytophthora fragariae]
MENGEDSDDGYDVEEIILPGGQRVPARPGRYRVTPPPNLNDTNEELFVLEYNYPEVIVRDAALRLLYNLERSQAQWQISEWQQKNGGAGGIAFGFGCGYAFNWCSAPAVVLVFTTDVDTMDDLQDKVSMFVDAGAREGVVVDISGEQVWIHNRGEEPRFEGLAAIEFDSWPGFTLDCVAIREERERERRRLGV